MDNFAQSAPVVRPGARHLVHVPGTLDDGLEVVLRQPRAPTTRLMSQPTTPMAMAAISAPTKPLTRRPGTMLPLIIKTSSHDDQMDDGAQDTTADGDAHQPSNQVIKPATTARR